MGSTLNTLSSKILSIKDQFGPKDSRAKMFLSFKGKAVGVNYEKRATEQLKL
jgi:hypothetical protein